MDQDMKKVGSVTLIVIAILALLILSVVLINTWRMSPDAISESKPVSRNVDGTKAATNLATAISYRTVSTDPDDPGFAAFREWLPTAYPGVHATMDLQVLGGGTLLYKWAGSDSAAKPVLLTGHYDVVPVNPGTIEDWSFEPFAGTVSDDYIWGRGALDNKSAVIAMLEAAEALIETGFQPKQTIYFSFGHDEELGGNEGAASVVQYFQNEGIRLAWSLDEGSYVLDDIFPGLEHPVASINVAEKGYVSLLIKAKGAGGHSSMPPRETAVGTLAKAIVKIQDNPLPGGFSGVSASMFEELAPHLGFSQRMLFANRWLFGSLLEGELSKTPSTNAMLRTTTAPTMLSGSIKQNILPTEAVATVNFRIHPRDSVESVQAYVEGLVASENIDVEVLDGRGTPPSAVASDESEGYSVIAQSLKDAFGTIIVLPGLTIAGTDSKHYSKVADDAYRINPFIVGPDDTARFHGIDERMSIKNMEKGVTAFMLLMERL